jgi:hypothetical protein
MICYEEAKKKAILAAQNLEEDLNYAAEYEDAYIFCYKAPGENHIINTGDDPPIVVMKETGEVMLMQDYVAISSGYSELRERDI